MMEEGLKWSDRFGTLRYQLSKWCWPPLRIYNDGKGEVTLHTDHKPHNFIANSISISFRPTKHWANERYDDGWSICFKFGWEQIWFCASKGPKGTKHHRIYTHLIDDEFGIRVKGYL